MTEQGKLMGSGLALDNAMWRKSSRSSDSSCVEVARAAGHVAVRDSKNPDGGALVFSSTAWRAFLSGAKRGEFDPRP